MLAYDRMIQAPDFRAYDSFNNVQVGVDQGSGRRRTPRRERPSSSIRGSSTDHNAFLFEHGFLNIMNPKYKSGYFKQGYTIWTPNWDDPTAGKEMDAACQADGSKIGGVYSMNDAMAADVYPAIVRRHLKKIFLTGQDAQPDGLGGISPASRA